MLSVLFSGMYCYREAAWSKLIHSIKINIPGLILCHRISTYLSLSGLLCSCQNPVDLKSIDLDWLK